MQRTTFTLVLAASTPHGTLTQFTCDVPLGRYIAVRRVLVHAGLDVRTLRARVRDVAAEMQSAGVVATDDACVVKVQRV